MKSKNFIIYTVSSVFLIIIIVIIIGLIIDPFHAFRSSKYFYQYYSNVEYVNNEAQINSYDALIVDSLPPKRFCLYM